VKRLLPPLFLFALMFVPATLRAGCADPIAGVTGGVSTINLIPAGAEPFGTTLSAIDTWAFGCNGSGWSYPDLATGAYNSTAGVMNVYVFYHAGVSTGSEGRCGYTDVYVNQQSGQIDGGTIHMWQQSAGGADCTATMDNLVAHELGHILGLGDVDWNSTCNGTIMGANPSYVSTDQCWALNDNWYTTEEQQEDERQANDYCTMNCWTACTGGICSNDGCGSCSSPIVLDLDNDGFKLTGMDERVLFDIDADGAAELITWTRGDQEDAFLCLDRDGNDKIDSGAELFGNHTPLLSTGYKAPNGYEALKELDANRNGAIDPSDPIWSELRLWIDSNHDGVSQPGELLTLDRARVLKIETAYIRANRRDAHGNLFRFKGKAWIANKQGNRRTTQTYDVYFRP
jgi:hypothetical protein